MRVRYFAAVRERVGKTEEDLELPPGIATVGDLIGWLRTQDESYAEALADTKRVRAALDRRHVKYDVPVAGAREIAFFPPMTGG